ncbi:hypothetical protein RJ40_11600 [Methanofollis aquaemaris]|uniref:UPF0146 protein RJ40_11600 n=1 Tax=Methanofollis aquaemaris TaxID=126734 RepID=A0A8A3S8W8_9EURY|nr:UPF0146 family protein [Methanofollis aquaemaris]QSZ68094.1 hypothetical protein RJ40_11600 [Methanofollis aquaemaris]
MASEYKRIEGCIAAYISGNYFNVVEIGIGRNPDVAVWCHEAGLRVRATDIREPSSTSGVETRRDDVFCPDLPWYAGADLVYAVRPGVEMVPALITLARTLQCDLLVYHLGDEVYLDGGERIECGVRLHRYCRASKRS